MAIHTGQQLGNYHFVRRLGHGGFAEVYLGEHVYLKSYAALKILHATLKEEEVERFLSEAQTLVNLRHPNIVRVLEFIFEQGTPALVMDYALGGSAREHIPAGTCLPLATTVASIKQVASALQYAHNRSIIHRDVKPENILFDSNQQILLSDFGLALFAPSPDLISTQEWGGTLAYMAPEQLQGKPTFASDQYALGVVTYEWLCGTRPFGGNGWALIHQHIAVPPPPLREKRPDLPAAVENVVLKALSKDPRDRYVSVQLFAQALERASQANVATVEDDTRPLAALKISSPPLPVTITTPNRPGASTLRQIFLTAAPGDESFAARLRMDLAARGAVVQEAGTLDQSALRQAISDARLMLVVVSPHTRSSRTVKEQLRIAGMYQQRMVFVWAEGETIAAVLPEAWGRTALIDLVDARGSRYLTALDEIIDYCKQEAQAASSDEALTLPMPTGEPRNPFKGLRAFTEEDTADFFGRDDLILELAETIEGMLAAEKPAVPGSRLLTVIGPSGSGKSSVVLAGLLPALRQSALPGSEAWTFLEPIVPGERPLESLALAIARHIPNRSLRSIRDDLEDDSARGLHLLATRLIKHPGDRVVLMIDQFEEVFTQTISEEERQRFIDVLVAAATEPGGPLLIVLTLRADFYDRPMQYPQLSSLIEAHQTAVHPMNPHELRAIIERPALLPDVQLIFEENLVGDMLFETQGQVGALPLLEFTLDQLFRLRDDHWLTRVAFQQIGGVKGALAKHAESTYGSLPSEEYRQLARALFLRLIDPGVTEQDTTRRRAAFSELTLPDQRQTVLLQQVADAFVAARLLTTNESAGTTTIEVSHEALIREWARLAEWLREARDDIIFQQTISADAAEWVRHGRLEDRLYRGSQLAEAQAWAARNLPSAEEMSFIQVGRETQEREETEKLARQERELLLQRQSSRRQRYVIGLMAVTSVILIVALIFTLIQQVQLRNSLTASVTNMQDNGPGSLRDAIATAHPNSTITFASDLRGTIQLTSEINIAQSLTISGPGANVLSISGQGKHRVFRVLKGADVTIFNLTIRDGFAPNCPRGCDTRGASASLLIPDTSVYAGGAILDGFGATLTLVDVTVSTSFSGYGAIFNNGTLTIQGSHISANRTSGLFNSNQGVLTLSESIVSGNTGAIYGGGINTWGSTTIYTSTIFDNTATYGGGLYTAGTLIVATLVNSTLSNNTAKISGGGICSPMNGPNVVYTTVYENRAGIVGGGIAENAGVGCGNYASGQNYSLNLEGSIVAGDSAPTGPDFAGDVSLDYPNLIQDRSGTVVVPCGNTTPECTSGQNSLFNVSPRLGPLQNNGGPTPTHALLDGSPALDRIPVNPSDTSSICANSTALYPTASDQRGVSRPQGKACDLGAYEARH
jgi:hypothetical protein